MSDLSKGARKEGEKRRTGTAYRIGLVVLAFLVFAFSSGCEDVKPLTPEQQSLMSAWSIRKSLQKAFKKESVKDVMALLGPSIANLPETRTQLERLFDMFKSLDLMVEMDAGSIDPATRSVTFMAHWTLTGLAKDKKVPHYFQTGECRLVVTLREAPHPSKIESLTGDNFMIAPAQPGPRT